MLAELALAGALHAGQTDSTENCQRQGATEIFKCLDTRVTVEERARTVQSPLGVVVYNSDSGKSYTPLTAKDPNKIQVRVGNNVIAIDRTAPTSLYVTASTPHQASATTGGR